MARWPLLGSWCCSTPTTCASYTFKFLRKLFISLSLSLSLSLIYARCFTLVVIVGTGRMHSSSSRRGLLHLYTTTEINLYPRDLSNHFYIFFFPSRPRCLCLYLSVPLSCYHYLPMSAFRAPSLSLARSLSVSLSVSVSHPPG